MITRKEWGAEPLTAYDWKVPVAKRTGIVIHHSVTAEGKSQKDVEAILRMIDGMHRRKGWGGIGYNLAVDFAGRVYEARGVNIVGCHAGNHNTANYGIVYIGDGRKRITPEAVAAIKGTVAALQKNSKKKLKVVGHRDVNLTACPGEKIYKLIKADTFEVAYPPKPAVVPPKPVEPAKPTTKPVTYVIARPGDSYWRIAVRTLGVRNTPNNYAKILKESKRIQKLNNNKPVIAGKKVRVA